MSKKLDYNELSTEIFKLHNELRTNPLTFISKLKESSKHFREKVYQKPGEDPIQTKVLLQLKKPLNTLKFKSQLEN